MNQKNNEKSFYEKLDRKHRNKSEPVFYKLLAKQKLNANPFDVVRLETYPAKEIKQVKLISFM